MERAYNVTPVRPSVPVRVGDDVSNLRLSFSGVRNFSSGGIRDLWNGVIMFHCPSTTTPSTTNTTINDTITTTTTATTTGSGRVLRRCHVSYVTEAVN